MTTSIHAYSRMCDSVCMCAFIMHMTFKRDKNWLTISDTETRVEHRVSVIKAIVACTVVRMECKKNV